MEVNLYVESLRFLVLTQSTYFVLLTKLTVMFNVQVKIIMKYFPMKNESIHMSNSTEELLQKDNFTVVAAIAASIKS